MNNSTKTMISGMALAALLGLSATLLDGCAGAKDDEGAGGAAGSTAAAGANGGAGATGTAGALAGLPAAGTTGAAGSTTSAAGGSTSAGTSACGPKCTTPTTCVPSVIASGITTLTDFSSNLDSNHFFHLGGVDDWTGLFGGTWVSPKASDPCAAVQLPPLTESFSEGSWHITGNIVPNQWSGAGFWFATGAACPVFDFSAYSGFSFTIAGNAGPSGAVTVTVMTASNSAPNTDTTSSNFTCYSNAATCAGATCTAASLPVTNITTTPQTVKVMFADLTNGAPVATPDRKEITGIGITPTIDWTGREIMYPLDLIIDDLTLIP